MMDMTRSANAWPGNERFWLKPVSLKPGRGFATFILTSILITNSVGPAAANDAIKRCQRQCELIKIAKYRDLENDHKWEQADCGGRESSDEILKCRKASTRIVNRKMERVWANKTKCESACVRNYNLLFPKTD